MLLALGMTLVIATGGVDLSVGAVMAISASVAAVMMNPVIIGLELPPDLMNFINDPNFTYSPLWEVILVTLIVATICGLWNGVLVAYIKIQPMVATLILMIAGRGIAQLITNGVRIQIFYEPYCLSRAGLADPAIFLIYCGFLVYHHLDPDAQNRHGLIHRVGGYQFPFQPVQRH